MTEVPSEFRVRPGESAEEYQARTERIFEEKRAAREDEKRRKDEEAALPERREREAAEEERGRRSRVAGQERAVSRALGEFEEERGQLYREDGRRIFDPLEHNERFGRLAEELRERVEGAAQEAEEDARRYEEEARGLSYIDPTTTVPADELPRLQSARTFVSEDCERFSVEELVERLRAVTTGDDKVAKALHARYGRFRLENLRKDFDQAARAGGSEAAGDEMGERARGLRLLDEALGQLDEDIADQPRAERAKKLEEAAAASRQAAHSWRSRLAASDGTDERAREGSANRIRLSL